MTEPTFEVRAFQALPAAAAVAVLVLEGRFAAGVSQPLGRPRLHLDDGEVRVDVAPVHGPEATAGPGGVPWRATFAVPLAIVDRASYALAIGRDLLVELPPPDLGERGDDADAEAARLARLAREANDLRRRLDAARDALAGAEARAREAETARRERDEARAELEATRAKLASAEETAREQAARAAAKARAEAARAGEEALVQAARRHEAALEAMRLEHEQALAAAVRDHERSRAEAASAHDEALAAQRARADAARRELQIARAELHALREAGATAETAEPRPARTQPERRAPVTDVTRPLDPDEESVRVLSRPPRPRHTPEDETEPAMLSPGATRIGARSITTTREGAADGRRRGRAQRVVALLALAIAIAAFVLVVVLRLGPG
ncbi:MAG TPA: hypothetical protein VFR97_11090 [Capillimicrobium sp.]|nr:hypothetical protein [Capillimicrobium sp.]